MATITLTAGIESRDNGEISLNAAQRDLTTLNSLSLYSVTRTTAVSPGSTENALFQTLTVNIPARRGVTDLGYGGQAFAGSIFVSGIVIPPVRRVTQV